MTEAKFRLLANKLIRKNIADRVERIAAIDALISEYVGSSGQVPDSRILDKLTDYLLSEEMKDVSAHKMQRDEYPILSHTQRASRQSTEVPLCQMSDKLSTIDIELYRHEDSSKKLMAEVNREARYYRKLNEKQPVHVRIMTEEERTHYSLLVDSKALFRGKEHVEWSLEVRRRDNFTCQKCGVYRRSGLHAHHIEAYNVAVDLRNEVINGITLCSSCHNDFHDTYGYGGNTRDQLNEWMRGDWSFEL